MHINIAKVNFKSIGINIAKVDFGLYDVAKPRLDGLYITPAGESTISVTPNSSYYTLHGKYLKYSFDGKTWNDWNSSVTIDPEKKMYINGEDDYVWNSSTKGKLITSTSYYNVGGDISSLTNFITEVREYTFTGLFNGDSYIKDAGNLILPATTLTQQCYQQMFSGCTSLTTAPELPATTLAPACYYYMFNGCSSLNSITMLATDISATSCLENWVSGVASTGTFTKAASMTSLPSGANGIPSGWAVVDYTDYLTLSALEDGEITITIPSGVNATYATSLSYSKDKSSWVETTVDSTSQTITIPVSAGEDVYLKGKAKQWSTNDFSSNINSDCNISSDCNINASGNIMSLLYGDDFKDKKAFSEGAGYIFRGLFKDNAHLINAENLILPATTLASYCYNYMFYNCSSLTTAPELPATTLTRSCYSNMFRGCTSLTQAPELPATTLTNSCYAYMFRGCTSLTQAPELPATTLEKSCYSNMFQDCTSLTAPPELPATILVDYCYNTMFRGCTSLTQAPELPATTLASYCYSYMFYGCKKLNNITMLATDISASKPLSSWVSGVSSTGTFTKAASMTTLPTGANGIPSGWTVVNK